MRTISVSAAVLVTMLAFSTASSAASIAMPADSLSIGGCLSNHSIGGGVVGLYCAGDIHGMITFPTSGNGTYQISIVMRADSLGGFMSPTAQISVDGAVIANESVTTPTFSSYSMDNVPASPGKHTLAIAFANGYTSAFPGFALYIQSIAITPNDSGSAPSATASPPSDSPDMYQQQLLNLINRSRASAGRTPLTFSAVQSAGNSSCVGSYGHSVHMAQVGHISHDQFPQDICIPWSTAGENVGMATGSESTAIQTLHQEMMNEGPSGGHYQNIMSTTFTTIGIGVYYANSALWLTEDFVK